MSPLLLLAAALTAAAPAAPRAAPSAESYLFVPQLDRLDGLAAFTQVAGRKSPLFRSAVWSEELLPVLGVDITSVEGLKAAGVDSQGPLTTSLFPSGSISCVHLSNVEAFLGRARASFSMQGAPWKGTVPNATFGAVMQEDASVTAGFVQRGKVGCVVRSPKARGGTLMEEAGRLLGSPKAPASWKAASALAGVVYLVSREAQLALRPAGLSLTADGRLEGASVGLPPLAGPGPSPYASLTPGGVLSLKARIDPGAVAPYARSFVSQLGAFCPGCDGRALSEASRAIAQELTGNVYLRVEALAVAGGQLKSRAGQYFAVRHAYAAEVKSAEAVGALLKKLERAPGLSAADGGLQLSTPEGTIVVQLTGRHLLVSNDDAARKAALAQLGKAAVARLPHGAELELSPKQVAKALRKISLLDVMASKELAGLFAAGIELGPLFAASQQLRAWAEPAAGGTRAQLQWTLDPPEPPRSTADAGM